MRVIRIGAMGRRIFAIVFMLTLASVLTFGGVTLATLRETALVNGQSQLETMLMQMKLGIEQDYQSLLQLSEQMMPSGPVGSIVADYLRAKDGYERGAAKRMLTKAMGTYGGLGTQLVMYYDELARTGVLFNFLADDAFSDGKAERTLFENAILRYHAIHPSHSRYSERLVVSLSRPAGFDDVQYGIYVERLSNAPQVIAEASEAQGIPYAMLQLDDKGVVRYSSDPDSFPMQLMPGLGEADFGEYGGHYYAKARFAFGATSVVLAPVAAFNSATASWTRRAGVAAVLIAVLMLLATVMLYRYVFKGLGVFKREIDITLSGDLESVSQRTGIEELDQMLWHFDRMKQNIKHMMREDAERTRALHRREREMLIYQINPHFLLNTLNSLHWVAAMNDQPAISRDVSSLSAILSYNLGRGQQLPTLRTELSMLDMYLQIEQTRHDFHVRREIEEGPHLDMSTPRLILQPIVENAIGHGMDEDGSLLIRVWADAASGSAVVEIADDGCGVDEAVIRELMGEEGHKMGGVGLKYVRSMLSYYYGGRGGLHIENRQAGGTLVRLMLPMDGGGEL